MRKINVCAALLWFVSCLSAVAQKPPDAHQVLAQAEVQASQQQKNILLIFGASWCKYCRQLDAFVEAPEIQPILAKHFVIARLNVYEELGRSPQLNNPKSEQLVREFGNADVGGLPFIVFLAPDGKLIVNSNRPGKGKDKGGNIGYPVEPKEIDWFMVMIKRAAPALTATDAATVDTWLRKASS